MEFRKLGERFGVEAKGADLSRLSEKVGGDTLFADQYAACDDLSSQMKTTIKELVALHHYGNRNDLAVSGTSFRIEGMPDDGARAAR